MWINENCTIIQYFFSGEAAFVVEVVVTIVRVTVASALPADAICGALIAGAKEQASSNDGVANKKGHSGQYRTERNDK